MQNNYTYSNTAEQLEYIQEEQQFEQMEIQDYITPASPAPTPTKSKTTVEYDEKAGMLIGTKVKRFQDLETGEIIELDQITKKAQGQRQFWKLYLTDFLQILGILESKQIDVLIYILEHTQPSTNMYIGTYRKTAEGAKVSQETCHKVMRKLQDNGFIKKIQNGVYQISPSIMMKGSERKKHMLLEYYYGERSY